MVFAHLCALTGPQPVSTLDQTALTELQIGLARPGCPVEAIDGQFGAAHAKFLPACPARIMKIN